MEGTLLGNLGDARGEPSETWQVGVAPTPYWVHPPEGRSFRAWCATCFSLDRDSARSSFDVETEESVSRALRVAFSMAVVDWRCLPARMMVTDPDLVPILTELLAGGKCSVEVCEDLPGLRAAQASFIGEAKHPIPCILTGEGVTIPQVAAFARAAADFQGAAPWRLLGGRDLLQIESSEGVEPALRHALFVASRGTWSLAFCSDEDTGKALRGGKGQVEFWYLALSPLWEVPAADADLWQQHGLVLSGEDDLCPLPIHFSGSPIARPNARQLAFFEGLLRVLAATNESEVDSGRWEKDVQTHFGPVHFVLSLPDLLALAELADPLRTPELLQRVAEQKQVLDEEDEEEETDRESLAEDPDAGAMIADLLLGARVLGGRRAVLLARQVLALRPDSSAAYLMLAMLAPTPAQALELFRRVQELADRASPLLPLRYDHEEDFHDEHETAWIHALRAREGISNALYDLGRPEEAVEPLREAVRLDSEDLMQVREHLACLLIELGRDDEAEILLAEGLRESSSGWTYTRALLAFRREGDSISARRALREAIHVNPLVPAALLPRVDLDPPRNLPVYEDDDIDAESYVDRGRNAWRRTPGALTWLAKRVEAPGIVGPGKLKSKGKKKRASQQRPQRKQKKKRRR